MLSDFFEAPSGVMTNLTFPFVSLPKEIIPDSSDKTAASLGFLASNKSATLGNPPVISLVFEATNGILVMTSPAVIFWPLVKLTKPPAGNGYIAGCLNSPTNTGFPFESTISIVGTWSLPAEGLSATSIISMLDIPVSSSVCSLTVTPSSISINLTFPAVSETIGRVYGSQEATCVPSPTLALSPTWRVAP